MNLMTPWDLGRVANVTFNENSDDQQYNTHVLLIKRYLLSIL